VEATVTRNYGVTANDKAKKLIQKLLFATGSVVLLVVLTMGRREAVVVGAAVIVTLAATLFASWAWGFTINRVSLFALIFSIGILVDDAIVVVENIHRHMRLGGGSLREIIPRAVDEVGGPTILATFTVIAALLPMAFVSGLMGPYMSPIPINSSLGMAISLAIAFTVTPWLALKLLKRDHAAAPERSQALVPAGRDPGRVGPVDGTGARAMGGTQDAAVRQQERIPGGGGNARRHAARKHRRCAARDGRLSRATARGARPARLCRNRQSDHFQRAGAPILSARAIRTGRPAGQPGRQAPPQRTKPRDCAALAPGARRDRPAPPCPRQARRGAARAAGHESAGGRGL